jgi:hypothetical protein
VTDYHPDNTWGASDIWRHHGAVAVGNCSAYVEANPGASDDALWVKAEESSGPGLRRAPRQRRSARDAGLLAAIDAVMLPMLFASMQQLGEHLRYTRLSLGASTPPGKSTWTRPPCE